MANTTEESNTLVAFSIYCTLLVLLSLFVFCQNVCCCLPLSHESDEQYEEDVEPRRISYSAPHVHRVSRTETPYLERLAQALELNTVYVHDTINILSSDVGLVCVAFMITRDHPVSLSVPVCDFHGAKFSAHLFWSCSSNFRRNLSIHLNILRFLVKPRGVHRKTENKKVRQAASCHGVLALLKLGIWHCFTVNYFHGSLHTFATSFSSPRYAYRFRRRHPLFFRSRRSPVRPLSS